MVGSACLGEVRSHPYQRELRWHLQVGRERAKNQLIARDEIGIVARSDLAQALDAITLEFQPDLVVYTHTWPHEAVPAEILARLKQRHGFKLFSVIFDYDEDNAPSMNFDRELISASDLVSIADSSWRATRIRNREGPYADFTNVDVVRFMPLVADPAIFKPSPVKTSDVTLAGSSEGYRLSVYTELLAAGFAVNRVGGLMPNDSYLSHHDYARALAESRIVVNTQTNGERVQLKGRTSQVLSCGSLLLEQWNRETERFLEPLGLKSIMWKSIDELTDMIRYWLDRLEERELFAASARERYIAAHNPRSWTETILEELALFRS